MNDVFELLLKKFPPDKYALMREVSNAPGFSRTNSADYVAMALWPSYGLAITGIEQKASRTDWLRELKQPAKSEAIAKHCDYFYLLTTTEGVCKLEEIPEMWGWLQVNGSSIKTMKEAVKRPAEISRTFFAAMLKRAANKDGWTLTALIQNKINEAYERGKTDGESRQAHAIQSFERFKGKVKEFESAAGIDVSLGWQDKAAVGAAVKFLLDGGADGLVKRITDMREGISNLLRQIDDAIPAIMPFDGN